MIIERCTANGHRLTLVDSMENVPAARCRRLNAKIAARFPDCEQLFEADAGQYNVIVVYSVLHYVFSEGNAWHFLDRALSLVAPGGCLLIGDTPNISKRKRFLSSEAGVRFHQEFMQTEEPPEVEFNRLEIGNIDDAVVLSMLMRARSQGFDAYVLPQPPELPMANRREDVLVTRP
jgi:hypothetical protein